ncbi:MAG: hypothetical protein GY841_12295 [FCB group bacterium]|nr:hypothetical protein [FCB group bacterium]
MLFGISLHGGNYSLTGPISSYVEKGSSLHFSINFRYSDLAAEVQILFGGIDLTTHGRGLHDLSGSIDFKTIRTSGRVIRVGYSPLDIKRMKFTSYLGAHSYSMYEHRFNNITEPFKYKWGVEGALRLSFIIYNYNRGLCCAHHRLIVEMNVKHWNLEYLGFGYGTSYSIMFGYAIEGFL